MFHSHYTQLNFILFLVLVVQLVHISTKDKDYVILIVYS
jgi:hypothetical protein